MNRWLISSLAGLAIVAVTRSHALAVSGTWSASATTVVWQTAANWTSLNDPGATSGTTNSDTATFNNSSTTKSIIPDLGRNLENITFDTAALAFTIGTTSGNSLLLTSGGETQIASTFIGSNLTETVNAPITLEGSYAFADNTSNTGDLLSFGGAITSGQSGTQTLTVTTADNVTIGGAIGGGLGTIGLLKNGAGTLTLGGNNTFTGGVQVNSGTLLLSNAGALNSTTPNSVFLNGSSTTLTLGNSVTVSSLTGNGIVQAANGAAAYLTVSNSSSDVFAGVLQPGAGGLGLEKSGAGTLTLSGNNSFTGQIDIDAGVLQLGSSGALGTLPFVQFGGGSTGTLVLNGNSVTVGTLITNSQANNPVVQNASATPATLTIQNGSCSGIFQDGIGGGALSLVIAANQTVLSGNNAFTGGVTITGGAVLVLGNAGALNSTTPNAVTFGSGSSGELDLNGNSVTISGLNTNATVGMPVVTNNAATPATLTLNIAGQSTFNGLLENGDITAFGVIKSGNGTLALGGASDFTGGFFIDAGGITIGNNSALGGGLVFFTNGTLQTDSNGPYNVSNPISFGNVTVSGSSNLTLSGGISGNGTLNKSGSNTLTISSGPNSFSGTLTITGGTVNMNSSLACNVINDSVFVYNSGTFSGRLTNLGTATFNAPFTAGNGLENDSILTISSGQSITLNGNGLNNTGTFTLAGGGLFLGSSSNFNSGTFNLSSTVPFNLGSASVTNSGTFNLNGGFLAGTFPAGLVNESGGVVVGSGTIQASFSNVGGTLLVSGGTTNVNSSFTNSGLVQLTAVNADLVGGTITNPTAGTIQGLGIIGNSIVNSGTVESISGTLILNGSLTNSASGLLAVDAGSKLLISQGLAANSGIINLTGGTFDNGGQPLTNVSTGQISGWGIFRTGGTGLDNKGSITFSGGLTTVNGPVTNESGETITIAQNPAIFTGHVTNNGGGTFNTTNTTATFAGGFTNNGSSNFAQVGNGLLEIDAAPTLNASSSLQVGSGSTLLFKAVSGAAIVQTNVTANVASGATLELAGTVSALSDPTSGNSVNIVNSATTASGGGLVVLGSNQQVGQVSGSGDTVVGNGASAASLIAKQILQNTLTINIGSTVTIAPSAGAGGAVIAASNATIANENTAAAAASDAIDSSSDPFTAIQAAILSGSISSTTGQRLENRIAAIEQLAGTDPGLDVSLLESRVLAALSPPPTSVLPSIGIAPPGDTGSGFLSVESSVFATASGPSDATAAFASSAGPTAVPEPPTLLLAAVAGIGLALTVRRRRIGR